MNHEFRCGTCMNLLGNCMNSKIKNCHLWDSNSGQFFENSALKIDYATIVDLLSI